MHKIRSTAILALVLALTLAAVPMPAAPQSEKKSYDAAWWNSLGNWEQAGFMNGYMDCHAFEYRGTVPFAKPTQAYVDALNLFYQQSGANKKLTVSQALDRIRGAASESSTPPVASAATPALHGGSYDGKFWFDAETPQVQLGFVEGYLACHTAKVKDADGRFSKSAEDYVPLINTAYGITDDTEEVDPQKAEQKIADVLHQLKDSTGK
jgi:hypothetical protein